MDRQPISKRSHALMLCKVGPKLGSIMEKDQISVKLFFQNRRNIVVATQEWFHF